MSDTTLRRILGPWSDPDFDPSPDILSLDLAWWVGSDLLPTLEDADEMNSVDDETELMLGFCGLG